MSLEKQVELSQLRGVFIELAYANLQFDKIPLETYVELIRAAGPNRVILSSDLGQPGSESVGSGWKKYFKLLTEKGISGKEVAQMSIENPHQLALGEI
jgi:predicted metal-dependent TIM-barrel fold hydrolase